MARTRFVVAVGIGPWIAAHVFRFFMLLAVGLVVLGVPLCWPLLVFSARWCSKPGQYCAAANMHEHVTATGWLVEVLWLAALALVATTIVKARKNRTAQPRQTAQGPRDWTPSGAAR